jgi:hypothetical protein
MNTHFSPTVFYYAIDRYGSDLISDPDVSEYTAEIRGHRSDLNGCGALTDDEHEHALNRIATATHILANFHNCGVKETWDHRCDRGDLYLI